jgi:hypothetical protein
MLCDILENIDHLYLHKMVGYNSTFLTMTCVACTPKFDGSSVVSTFSMAFFRGILTNLIFRQIQIKLLAISLTNPYYTSWCGWFANSCKLYYNTLGKFIYIDVDNPWFPVGKISTNGRCSTSMLVSEGYTWISIQTAIYCGCSYTFSLIRLQSFL